tara:strand:- start:8690 stop:9013 length:324 start_codon:yes stop_codon:yes gene_type:complete
MKIKETNICTPITHYLNSSICLKMDYIFWIGCLAACFSSLASLPQLFKAYRHGSTQDLHPLTMVIRSIGCLLWSFYAITKKDLILLISSVIALLVEVLLLIAKYIYT